MAARMDIALQRNEDWARTFIVTAGGEPVDLTGWSAEMQIKSRVDNATIIATADCSIDAPTAGLIDVHVAASEGSPLNSYGSPIQTENLPYDLRLIDPDGNKIALVGGIIILTRGVTQNG